METKGIIDALEGFLKTYALGMKPPLRKSMADLVAELRAAHRFFFEGAAANGKTQQAAYSIGIAGGNLEPGKTLPRRLVFQAVIALLELAEPMETVNPLEADLRARR